MALLENIAKDRATNDVTGDINFTGAVAISSVLLASATEVTIASGAVTITQGVHTVDTEADAASDDLDTINGGTDGTLLRLYMEDAARVVTLKHNVGNILVSTGADITMSANGFVTLLQNAAGDWLVTTAATGVSSVYSRAGNVVAAASDYDASEVDNDSGVTGAFVKDALDTLDSGKADTGHSHGTDGITNDSGVSGATASAALDTLDSGKADTGHGHAASGITNDSGVSGTNVDDALDTLDSGKAAASHNHDAADVNSGTMADARISQASVDQHGVTAAAVNRVPKANGSALLDEAWVPDFVGDSGAGGTKGAVPAPSAGDAAAGKLLHADGTWVVEQPIVGTYRTMTFSTDMMQPEATNPPGLVTVAPGGAADMSLPAYAFDPTTEESLFIQFAMIDPWPGGTIKVRFVYHSTAGANVVWGASGGCYADGDLLTSALGTEQTVTDGGFPGSATITDPTAALTFSVSPTSDNAMCVLKIARKAADGGDVNATDANLFLVHIQMLEDTTEQSAW